MDPEARHRQLLLLGVALPAMRVPARVEWRDELDDDLDFELDDEANLEDDDLEDDESDEDLDEESEEDDEDDLDDDEDVEPEVSPEAAARHRMLELLGVELRARRPSNPAPGDQVNSPEGMKKYGRPMGWTIVAGMRAMTKAQQDQFDALPVEQKRRFLEARRDPKVTPAQAFEAATGSAPTKRAPAKKAAPAKVAKTTQIAAIQEQRRQRRLAVGISGQPTEEDARAALDRLDRDQLMKFMRQEGPIDRPRRPARVGALGATVTVPFTSLSEPELRDYIYREIDVARRRRGFSSDEVNASITDAALEIAATLKKAAPAKKAPAKAAKKAASIAPSGAKPTDRDKRMVRAYVSGKSLSEIAAKEGISASTVHTSLIRQGVQLRPRGGVAKKAAPAKAQPGRDPAGYPDVPPGLDIDEDTWARMSYDARRRAIAAAAADAATKAAPAKAAGRVTGYRLTRTLPDGTEKTWPTTFKTRREAEAEAVHSLHYNTGTTRAEANKVGERLSLLAPGETVKHESGYSFRVDEVREPAPAKAPAKKAAPSGAAAAADVANLTGADATELSERELWALKYLGNMGRISETGNGWVRGTDMPSLTRERLDRLAELGAVEKSGTGDRVMYRINPRSVGARTPREDGVLEGDVLPAGAFFRPRTDPPREAAPTPALPAGGAAAADAANLTGADREAFLAWLRDNPGKSVAQWQAQRREVPASESGRLRNFPRLTDAAMEAARQAVAPFRNSTQQDHIEAELRAFNAADLLRVADVLNINIPASARSAPAMRLYIAQTLAAHNRRTRGGV